MVSSPVALDALSSTSSGDRSSATHRSGIGTSLETLESLSGEIRCFVLVAAASQGLSLSRS
jgi:hypothetical protein